MAKLPILQKMSKAEKREMRKTPSKKSPARSKKSTSSPKSSKKSTSPKKSPPKDIDKILNDQAKRKAPRKSPAKLVDKASGKALTKAENAKVDKISRKVTGKGTKEILKTRRDATAKKLKEQRANKPPNKRSAADWGKPEKGNTEKPKSKPKSKPKVKPKVKPKDVAKYSKNVLATKSKAKAISKTRKAIKSGKTLLKNGKLVRNIYRGTKALKIPTGIATAGLSLAAWEAGEQIGTRVGKKVARPVNRAINKAGKSTFAQKQKRKAILQGKQSAMINRRRATGKKTQLEADKAYGQLMANKRTNRGKYETAKKTSRLLKAGRMSGKPIRESGGDILRKTKRADTKNMTKRQYRKYLRSR